MLLPREPPNDRVIVCSCTTTSLSSAAGKIIVLRIAGEVDMSSRHLVQAALAAVLDRRLSHVLVDLSGLSFCDLHGLAMLANASGTAADHGIYFAVTAAPRTAQRVWELLWPENEVPIGHQTVRAGALAAMKDQNARHGVNRRRMGRVVERGG